MQILFFYFLHKRDLNFGGFLLEKDLRFPFEKCYSLMSFLQKSLKLCGIFTSHKLSFNNSFLTFLEIAVNILIKLTETYSETCQTWRRSGVFIVNFEHISHLVLVFLLLTLSR